MAAPVIVPAPKGSDLATAIESRIERRRDGCWRWHGTVDPKRKNPTMHEMKDGKSRVIFVRRYLYAERHGSVPHNVIPGCGNLWCVNPEHATKRGQR